METHEVGRCPTGKELEERDFSIFKQKVKKLGELEMYTALGQAIAFCAHDENDDRKTAERSGRKEYVDGIQKFINTITEIDPETISASYFVPQLDKRQVAKSMHSLADHLKNEAPKNPELVYHACAYVLGNGYKGSFGWEGLGRNVADSVKNCSSYKDLRDCVAKGLVN